MAKQKSDELNAQLAESIKAQPVSAVAAAVKELRDAGLHQDADELEVVLREREAKLAEARAAREAEEAAVHAKAVAKARADYDAIYAKYLKALDEAFEHLARYVEVARPAATDYNEVGVAFQRLAGLLGPNDPSLPELPPTPSAYAKNGPYAERLKGISL